MVLAVQKRLLAEADLTLARAVTTAQSMEAADRNAKSFKTTDSIAIRKVSTTFHRSHSPGGASGDTRLGSVAAVTTLLWIVTTKILHHIVIKWMQNAIDVHKSIVPLHMYKIHYISTAIL